MRRGRRREGEEERGRSGGGGAAAAGDLAVAGDDGAATVRGGGGAARASRPRSGPGRRLRGPARPGGGWGATVLRVGDMAPSWPSDPRSDGGEVQIWLGFRIWRGLGQIWGVWRGWLHICHRGTLIGWFGRWGALYRQVGWLVDANALGTPLARPVIAFVTAEVAYGL